MGDPHRLLSRLSDGDDFERELLASIQRADPPEHAKAEAWSRLSAQIAAVALVSSAHGSAAASAGGTSVGASGAAAEGAKAAVGAGIKGTLAPAVLKALGTKAVVALALAGTAIGASAVWVHSRAAEPQASQVAAPAQPLAALKVDPNSAMPAEPATDTAAPSSDTNDAPAPAQDSAVKPSAEQTRRDQLSAESALLTHARAALRKGDVRGAQQALNRLRVQFPKGVLGQEREVLAIEVLAASGNAAAAKHRAQVFIAAHPESPHSAQLSRFTE
jgi:hypothetical protein